MLIKFMALIALGLSLSLGELDVSSAPAAVNSYVPSARFSLCLGPMSIGFGTSDGAPVNLIFGAHSTSAARTSLVHAHMMPPINPLKIHPSTDAPAQILLRRLPALP